MQGYRCYYLAEGQKKSVLSPLFLNGTPIETVDYKYQVPWNKYSL